MEQDRQRNPEQEGIGTVEDLYKVLADLRANYTKEGLHKVLVLISAFKDDDGRKDSAELRAAYQVIKAFKNLLAELDKIDDDEGLDKVHLSIVLAGISRNPKNVNKVIEQSEQGFDKIIDSDGRGRLEP